MEIETGSNDRVDCTPDALASGLRRGCAKVIGLVLPNSVNPYDVQLRRAVVDECYAKGYLTLTCNTDSDVVRERSPVAAGNHQQLNAG